MNSSLKQLQLMHKFYSIHPGNLDLKLITSFVFIRNAIKLEKDGEKVSDLSACRLCKGKPGQQRVTGN